MVATGEDRATRSVLGIAPGPVIGVPAVVVLVFSNGNGGDGRGEWSLSPAASDGGTTAQPQSSAGARAGGGHSPDHMSADTVESRPDAEVVDDEARRAEAEQFFRENPHLRFWVNPDPLASLRRFADTLTTVSARAQTGG